MTVTVTGEGRLDFAQFAVSVHDIVNSRATSVGTFLCNVGNDVFGIEGQLAIVGLEVTEQHGKQR